MLKPLKTREKVALGLMAVSVASSLVFIILLSVNLTYEMSSKSGTYPTFTVEPDVNCPNDLTTAYTNNVSMKFTKGGAGLYTTAIVSLVFSIAAIAPIAIAIKESRADTIEEVIKNMESKVLRKSI